MSTVFGHDNYSWRRKLAAERRQKVADRTAVLILRELERNHRLTSALGY